MPQLPTPAATGDVWGTQLNTFLTTALDNTAANGGMVKPEGILGGTTGQVLTSNASGVPTWGSAVGVNNVVDLSAGLFVSQIVTVQEGSSVTFLPSDPTKTTLLGLDIAGGGAGPSLYVQVSLGNFTNASLGFPTRLTWFGYTSSNVWTQASSVPFPIKFVPTQQISVIYVSTLTTGSMQLNLKWI